VTDTEITLLCRLALDDDAQAMALVKECRLHIQELNGDWCVSAARFYGDDVEAFSNNLNRAICECVAKMMQEKK